MKFRLDKTVLTGCDVDFVINIPRQNRILFGFDNS